MESASSLHLVEWIRGAGAPGVLVYALAYVIATLFLLPGSILTAGAGFAVREPTHVHAVGQHLPLLYRLGMPPQLLASLYGSLR
jgi:hypothetical protein